jgi:hypothetical protein
MWLEFRTWVKGYPILVGAFAILLIAVFSAASVGISARNAASRYLDLAKGWATAYNRDTAASKKEYDQNIAVLTADRNAYRKKWEAARGKMNAPWKAPKNAKDLQGRFNRMGFRGDLR